MRETMSKNLTNIVNNNLLTILSTSFISLTLIATIVATKVSSFWGVSAASGIIIFPLTFVVKDMIQKRFGRKSARLSIWLANITMAFAFMVFYLVGLLPPDSHWVNQEAYNAILTPVGRIVLASILAGLTSELIDTQIFSYIFNRGHQLWAAVVSNIIGTLIDSAIFTAIAFYGSLPNEVVVSIFVTNALIKLAATSLGSPSIFLVKRSPTADV